MIISSHHFVQVSTQTVFRFRCVFSVGCRVETDFLHAKFVLFILAIEKRNATVSAYIRGRNYQLIIWGKRKTKPICSLSVDIISISSRYTMFFGLLEIFLFLGLKCLTWSKDQRRLQFYYICLNYLNLRGNLFVNL